MPELTNTASSGSVSGVVGGDTIEVVNNNVEAFTENDQLNKIYEPVENTTINNPIINIQHTSPSNNHNEKQQQQQQHQNEVIRLPWGSVREKPNPNASFLNNNNNSTLTSQHHFISDKKKPGEYLMQIVVFNFIQLSSKKFDHLSKEKRDRRLKDCFQKGEDINLDRLVITLGQVAEHSLPSLTRTLLIWHESQLANINYLKQQQQLQFESNLAANSSAANPNSNKSNLASKFNNQRLMQAKLENDLLDERKELIVHALLCICLIEVLKQLSLHPGNDEILNYIIDLSFQRFMSKDQTNQTTSSSFVLHHQLYLDNLYITDLYAEVIGTIAQSRFILVKRRFLNEFNRFKSPINNFNSSELSQNQSNSSSLVTSTGGNIINSQMVSSNNSNTIAQQQNSTLQNNQNATLISNSNTLNTIISPTSANRIKLLMGMKYFRIKMVPIEDFEASFQFLNACAQDFVESKDKDIKHTLAGLFVDILVPITGVVKNEVNVPCLRQFVDILYQSALELSAKTKHRFSTFPLLTCLLCVSQRQFFLNNWFQFVQLCLQQLKTKESNLARLSLESIVRLVWIYMIRIKGEKSNETYQRLSTIIQTLFPKGTKMVNPKETPANIYVKLISYIAYERLDFAMKEIIYELLSIDVNNINNSQNNQNSDQNMLMMNNQDASNLLSNANSNNLGAPNQSNLSSNLNASNSSNVANALLNPNLNLNGSLNNSLNSLSSSAFKTSKENLNIMPLRMEIGLKAFVQIADILQQQKENGLNPPSLPLTFSIPNNDSLSIYLNNQTATSSSSNSSLPKQRSSSVIQSNLTNEMISQSQLRVVLTDSLARDIGLGNYFDLVRRSFQDILKTLDFTIGRNFLMTRVENTSSSISSTNDLFSLNEQNLLQNFDNNNKQQINNTNELNDISNSTSIKIQDSTSSNIEPNIESNSISQMNKELILNAENKSKLCLMRTCIAMIPRMMPQFKENELIEILTRLTIHIDDELRIFSFQALKTFVHDYPKWRIHVFTGFTNFILKEISDMYPKLVENALKMLIQLLNTWKLALNINKTLNNNINTILIEDCCKIIFHLEGFSLFALSHSHIQRRRLGLEILKECKNIGEMLKCFKFYPYHNYAIDVLDLASIQAIKTLHLQCFNFSLIVSNMKPDLKYLIDQSANWEVYVNTSNYNSIFNSNNTNSSNEPVNVVSASSSSTINSSQQQLQQQQQSPQVNSSSFYNNIITKSSRTSSTGVISTPSNPVNAISSTEPNGEPVDLNQSIQLNINQLDTNEANSQNNQQNQQLMLSSANNNSNNNNTLLQIQPQPLVTNSLQQQPQNSLNINNQQQKEQEKNQQTQSTVTLLSHRPHSFGAPLNQNSNQPAITVSNTPNNNNNNNNNMFAFDPWTECLSIFFSYDFIYTKCPQASYEAWPFIFNRLQNLLPYVDPNEQHHETSRSSILFGVGANSLEKIRKAMNERDANLNLWKNYLIAACCLTSGSDRYLYYSDHEKALIKTTDESNEISNLITNSATATAPMNVDFTIVESSSKFYTSSSTFGTATSLLKIIVPFLKCECNYFREIVIRGLGRINIEAIRDLIEELSPYIKECLDKRQEKSRRMKKRDTIRLAIVYIFELMAEQRTLGRRLIDTKRKLSHLKSHQHQLLIHKNEELFQIFRDYIDQMLLYLDQESDKINLDLNLQIRIHFSLSIHKLIDSINRERRINLFSSTTRHNLFHLFDKWSGRFSLNYQQNSNVYPTNTQSVNLNNLSTSNNFTQPGLLSLSRFSSTPTNTLTNTGSFNANQNNSNNFPTNLNINKNQLYTHHYHSHYHQCYHFYDELELAATKACAALLCSGDISEITLINHHNQNSTQSLTINTNTNSVIFLWLSQLLENANQEMKIYDQCKCVLRNEIYTLSLNVCIQLLELSLYNSTNLNSFQLLFDWIIKKCYSSISQEIADLCFLALAKVFIEYINQILINKAKLQQHQTQQPTNSPTKLSISKIVSSSNNPKNCSSFSNQNNSNMPSYQKTIDSIYLSNLLTLSLLNIGSTRLNIHETSICLLRIINKYYLQDMSFNSTPVNTISNDVPLKVVVPDEETNMSNTGVESKASTLSSASSSNKSESLKLPSKANLISPIVTQPITTNTTSKSSSRSREKSLSNNPINQTKNPLLDIDYDIINSMVIYSKSQLFISEYLARKNPEKTMFIFCEITSRLEQCSSHQLRRTMLNVLIPWLYNIELIDPNVIQNISNKSSSLPKTTNGLAFLQLQSGYGSIEATEIILNNLFYLTCKFADQYSTEFELLWAILAFTWPSNLKIIIRFIFIMISLASYDMINNGKNVICYLAKACPERVSDELTSELEFMDSLSNVLDKCESLFPFYRYNKPVPQPPPSPPPQYANSSPNLESISSVSPNKTQKTKKKTNAFTYVVNHEDDVFSDDIDDDEDDESDEFDESEEDEEDNSDEFELDDDDDDDDETDDSDEEDENKLNESDNESDNKLFINKQHKQKDKLSENIRRNEKLLSSSNTNMSNIENSNNKIMIVPLPMPSNYKTSYACPLNVLLYHVGHQHQHSHHNSIYSYHNNYMHHNHYPHISNISRGSISLMLLCELIGTDGADYDWTPYLPILFHYCLINFDSTKQIIGEHAKKLFLNLIYILTVQNELYSLTDFLIESIGSIIDSQSIIFDRKYTNNNYIDAHSSLMTTSTLNNNQQYYNSKFNWGNCQYNYNFNMRIFSANLKGYSNNLLNNNITLMNSPSHRALINIHSAPSSPASQNIGNKPTAENSNNNLNINTNNSCNQDTQYENQCQSKTDINKKSNQKRQSKIQKAKEHLSIILSILAKSKNSPVWPYELITSQNYSKPLTSVQLINDFVSNLQSFLQICFSTKQVSTISSSSTRSFSSPLILDLNRFNGSQDKYLTNIDKKWSHYALISSLNTTSRHYAGRSLQIYRALGIKFNSFSTMINFIHRLMETVADTNEDVQGYVTEILLTLKMNANLFSVQYLKKQSETSNIKNENLNLDAIKQKSKSLQLQFQDNFKIAASKQQKKILEQNNTRKSATGSLSLSSEVIKNKTATLTRKEANEIIAKKSSLKSPDQRLLLSNSSKLQNTKYKHQIAYKKSLTLSLFNHKWQLIQERIGNSNLQVNRVPKFLRYFSHIKSSHQINTNAENLKVLVQIFWTAICLLESDFEHEFVLAIEIIEQILEKIDLNSGLAQNGQLLIHKNEFRTHLEMFAFKINWPNFPGLQNILLKGCISTNQTTLEATNRILVYLIPHCSKLNFVDPNGMNYNGLWGLSMNIMALLPIMIYNYESPNDLCIKAAESYCKVIKEQIRILEEQQQKPQNITLNHQQQNNIGCMQKLNKIENLKNLVHVMNLYLTNSFGKDRLQWTKCVITYLSEFFQQCKNEILIADNSNKSNFYLNWIVFLTELLDKHSNNYRYQTCIIACLNSLLNFIDFNDQSTWSFINEELTRVIVKYINTNLWNEALDLIKLTVSKSSSLTGLKNETTFSSNNNQVNFTSNIFNTQVPLPLTNNQLNLFGKKELPGRTLEFDFDFSLFLPNQDQFINFNNNSKTPNIKKPNNLPLNLIDFHTRKQYQQINEYITGCSSNNYYLNGWKRPQASQIRTREKFLLLLSTLTRQQSINNLNTNNTNTSVNETVNTNNLVVSNSSNSLKKSSTSIIFENSLNNSNQLRFDENLNSTTNENITGNNNDLTTTNPIQDSSLIITSPIKLSNQNKDNNSYLLTTTGTQSFTTDTSNSTSNTASTSTSSSTSSKNTQSNSSSTSNLTNSSNNSLNQTSFITSPSTIENNKFLMKKPVIISPKPILNNSNQSLTSPTNTDNNNLHPTGHSSKPSLHQRKNSTIYVKQSGGSLVPITQTESTIQIDDNNYNFINNTFSFLDDMDNINDQDGNVFGSNLTTVKEDSFNQNDNVTWDLNVINPINDSEQKGELISPSTLKSSNEKLSIEKRSSTFSFENDETTKATFRLISSKTKPIAPKIKAPSATIGVASGVAALKAFKNENVNNSNLYFNLNKNKPVAPSIKNNNNNEIVSSDLNLSNNHNNLILSTSPQSNQTKLENEKVKIIPNEENTVSGYKQVIYKHQEAQIIQSPIQNINDQENRRRSITRIIKSGSYQNINQNIRHFSVSSILNKKPAPTQPTSSLLEFQQTEANTKNSNNLTNNQPDDQQSNSINQLSTSPNLIYDHQSMSEKFKSHQKSPPPPPTPPEPTHDIFQIINQRKQKVNSAKNTILNNMANLNNKFENILQNKRTKLRVSSVNNLSNLLAMDESSKSVNVDPKNINININLITDKSSLQTPQAILNINSSQAVINIVKNQPIKKGLSPSYSSSSLSTIHSQTEHDKNYELLKRQQEIYLKKSINSIYNHVEPYINLIKSDELDIDNLWKLHVNSTLKSSSNSDINIIETFILFKLLFNNIRSNLNNLLNQCCHELNITNKLLLFQKIESHLVEILGLINNKLNCPVIYLDQSLVNNHQQEQESLEININIDNDTKQFYTNNVIEKHKHIVWEIGENYDTFVYLRQSVLESLESIKKLEESKTNAIETNLKKIELCKKLGKLLSQLMLLLQSSTKLIPNITKNLINQKVLDKSSELTEINKKLIEAFNDYQLNPSNKPECSLPSSKSHILNQFVENSKEMFTYLILDSVKQNNFIETVQHINGLINNVDISNIDIVLLFVCEQIRLKHPNMIAVIDLSSDQLAKTSQEILQLNIELTTMIDSLEKKIKESSITSISDGEEIDC